MVILHLSITLIFLVVLVILCLRRPSSGRVYKQANISKDKAADAEITSSSAAAVATQKKTRASFVTNLQTRFADLRSQLFSTVKQAEACPAQCGDEALWDSGIAPFGYCTKCTTDGDCGHYCEPYSYRGNTRGNCGCVGGRCRQRNNMVQRTGDAGGATAANSGNVVHISQAALDAVREGYNELLPEKDQLKTPLKTAKPGESEWAKEHEAALLGRWEREKGVTSESLQNMKLECKYI